MLQILPESDEKTLVVKASEILTAEDYEQLFIPELEKRLEHQGKINAVILFSEDFKGWEAEAAWDDMVFGIQHRNDFDRIAIAADQKWLHWASNIGAYFMEGQIKTFPVAEFSNAVAWVKKS